MLELIEFLPLFWFEKLSTLEYLNLQTFVPDLIDTQLYESRNGTTYSDLVFGVIKKLNSLGFVLFKKKFLILVQSEVGRKQLYSEK